MAPFPALNYSAKSINTFAWHLEDYDFSPRVCLVECETSVCSSHRMTVSEALLVVLYPPTLHL